MDTWSCENYYEEKEKENIQIVIDITRCKIFFKIYMKYKKLDVSRKSHMLKTMLKDVENSLRFS